MSTVRGWVVAVGLTVMGYPGLGLAQEPVGVVTTLTGKQPGLPAPRRDARGPAVQGRHLRGRHDPDRRAVVRAHAARAQGRAHGPRAVGPAHHGRRDPGGGGPEGRRHRIQRRPGPPAPGRDGPGPHAERGGRGARHHDRGRDAGRGHPLSRPDRGARRGQPRQPDRVAAAAGARQPDRHRIRGRNDARTRRRHPRPARGRLPELPRGRAGRALGDGGPGAGEGGAAGAADRRRWHRR